MRVSVITSNLHIPPYYLTRLSFLPFSFLYLLSCNSLLNMHCGRTEFFSLEAHGISVSGYQGYCLLGVYVIGSESSRRGTLELLFGDRPTRASTVSGGGKACCSIIIAARRCRLILPCSGSLIRFNNCPRAGEPRTLTVK